MDKRAHAADDAGIDVVPPAGLIARRLRIDEVDVAILSFPTTVMLSESEHAVAAALLSGMKNADIARARGTSARTIANQTASLFRKLGVRSRSEFVAFAVFFGGSPQLHATEPASAGR